MIDRNYIESGKTWYYEGRPYRCRPFGQLYGIEGGAPPYLGSYGIVTWVGEEMITVTVINFGRESSMKLLYEDMTTDAAQP